MGSWWGKQCLRECRWWFFADLVARGLGGVMLVTSDAHAGLVEAIAVNPPGAPPSPPSSAPCSPNNTTSGSSAAASLDVLARARVRITKCRRFLRDGSTICDGIKRILISHVMSVKVTSGVFRAYRETEESVGVLVKAAVDKAVLVQVVQDVVEQFAASDDPVDQLTPVEFQPTMSGPAVVLSDVNPDDVRPVLERLGQRLAAQGVGDVTLTAMPTVNPLGRGPGYPSLIQAWLGLRGSRPDGWKPLGWPANDATWDVASQDLNAAIEQIAGWALALPADRVKVAVRSETYWVPVPAHAALDMVRRTASQRRIPLANALIVTAADGRMRWVDLYHWSGSVVAAQGTGPGVPLDWRPTFADMRTLLAEVGPWCVYGHLTRSGVLEKTPGNGDRGGVPPWRNEVTRGLIDSGTLIDAYGVMRLTRNLADRLDLEPIWTRGDLLTNNVLAEHGDLEAWYGAPHIRDDVIAEARTRLGNAVIDRAGESLNPLR